MGHKAMRVGLLAIGNAPWLGGAYYISNLIRALRALPEDQQPSVTLRKRARLALLFPCTQTIGPAFPVPWLAWVWDLQHRFYPDFSPDKDRQWRDQLFTTLAAEWGWSRVHQLEGGLLAYVEWFRSLRR
jgi:hypothetical protein